MLRNLIVVASIVGALGLALCTEGLAAKFNKKVDIGQDAPKWEGLTAVDGKSRSLADYKDKELLLLVFTCNSCPVAAGYEERVAEFAEKYKDKVAVVAINCSTQESAEDVKERAEAGKFKFDYLDDPAQKVGREYGATVTPHFFLLDKDRKIAYMGAFDDNLDLGERKHVYVDDAAAALLSGKSPERKETKQFGCGIQYE